MKKAIAGILLATMAAVAVGKGSPQVYMSKQEITTPQGVKSFLYGYLIGGCGPYGCERLSYQTDSTGKAEVYYPCQTEGTWVWTDGNASGTTDVPQEQFCYAWSDPRLPSLPILNLHY